MSIKITFLGAAGMVTGSCYFVEYNNTRFIVDAGMFQGPGDEEHNFDEYPFDPGTVDFLLLTHAHLDHIGLLPKLVRAGFRGTIYSTLHTRQIGSIIMADSAKIQENNFSRGIPWEHTGRVQMLYNARDVEQALSQFENVEVNQPFNIRGDISAEFVPAAHILGAASIEVTLGDKRVVFSGDIGRREQPLVLPVQPEHKVEVDYVLMESLYGGQQHPARLESVQELINIIRETTANGGNIFIPSFAVQRTQELLHDFKLAKQSGALPKEMQFYLDSPMALNVTNLYSDALDHTADSLFHFPGLNYVSNSRRSAKLSKQNGIVVIAGSGMANGGRIVMHLSSGLRNAKNAVVFVGYQAEATMGRELVDGAKQVMIDDVSVPVKAKIIHLHGFSAHGDSDDLESWVHRYKSDRLKEVILIHAEDERRRALADIFGKEGIKTQMPQIGQTIEL